LVLSFHIGPLGVAAFFPYDLPQLEFAGTLYSISSHFDRSQCFRRRMDDFFYNEFFWNLQRQTNYFAAYFLLALPPRGEKDCNRLYYDNTALLRGQFPIRKVWDP
jgi:hypothetical protein